MSTLNVLLKKKIDGQLYDLLVKSKAELIEYNSTNSVKDALDYLYNNIGSGGQGSGSAGCNITQAEVQKIYTNETNIAINTSNIAEMKKVYKYDYTTMTFGSGFRSGSTTAADPTALTAYKNGHFVELTGAIYCSTKTSSASTAATVVTLPEAIRPLHTVYAFNKIATTAYGHITINPNGIVTVLKIYKGSTTTIAAGELIYFHCTYLANSADDYTIEYNNSNINSVQNLYNTSSLDTVDIGDISAISSTGNIINFSLFQDNENNNIYVIDNEAS